MKKWSDYINFNPPPAVVKDYSILCPKPELLYRAFTYFEPHETKVVILGQDPYHAPGKASGLAFGYHKDFKGPVRSSIASIIASVRTHAHQEVEDLSLESWAKQGVLLLNTRLSTRENQVLAHAHLWKDIIEHFVREFSKDHPDVIWMLWGAEAKKFKKLLPKHTQQYCTIETSHPCKYSVNRGFRDNKQFAIVNFIRWGKKIED